MKGRQPDWKSDLASTAPPPPQNSGNSADNRSGESRKRPWHPPTVKTVALDQTFSGSKENTFQSESEIYHPPGSPPLS